jgi:hypothetical protein
MRAQELANDLAHQLELVESERDDLKLRLDEAEAVIDAVRKVRDVAARSVHQDEESAALASNEIIRSRWLSRRDTWGKVVVLLDRIDGL